MKQLHWFSPQDHVSPDNIKQAGCTGVVSAFHHVSNGEIWSVNEISERKKIIELKGTNLESPEAYLRSDTYYFS